MPHFAESHSWHHHQVYLVIVLEELANWLHDAIPALLKLASESAQFQILVHHHRQQDSLLGGVFLHELMRVDFIWQ